MAKYNYKENISFDLPDDYELQSEFNDDGDEIFTIRGDFYLDDDFERQSKYSCRISEGTVEWDEESKGKTMRQLWTDGFATKENIRYVVLQDRPAVLFSTMGQSMLMFGREFRMMATTVFVEVAHDQFLILIGITPYNEEEPDNAVVALEKMRKVLGALRINGKKAVESIPNAEKLFSAVKPCYDGSEPIDTGFKLNITVNGAGSSTTYEYGANSQEPTITSFSLNRATPDEKLYPHYSSMKFGPAAMLSMMGAQVNATGTEYSFQALSKELDTLYLNPEDGPSEEHKDVLRRIVDADTGYYNLHEKAEQMIPLFRVDPSVFDAKHDRECELADGLMHRSYMMSALRSFAWSLSDWCVQKGVEPADLEFNEINQIVSFVSMQSWLNYDETYCNGLCGCPDLHVYYVPDGTSYLDKQALLPSAEQLAEIETIKEKFPNFNQILTTVHSLDDLRTDLEYIFPAIETIYAKLAEDRDRMQPLTGDAADILYAWCALTLAAKEPFFTEDGPMNCWFEQKSGSDYGYVSERPAHKAKENSAASSRIANNLPAPKHNEMDFDDQGRATDYWGDEANLVFPTGTKIIGENILFLNENIKTLVIPEGVTTIEDSAIGHCKALGSVTLPKSLKIIGNGAFSSCEELEAIVLPEGLLEIGENAFYGCKKLISIVVPASVKKVGAEAFQYCESLQSLLIQGTQVKLAASAVSGCKMLKKIECMSETEIVGDIRYSYCKEMEEFLLPAAPEKIGEGAFSGCDGLTVFEVPKTVKRIENEAFRFCSELRHIYIPASVVEFGEDVFEYAYESLMIHAEPGSAAESYAKKKGFAVSNDMTVLKLIQDEHATENGFEIFATALRKYTGSQINVVIPAGVTVIEQNAFESCTIETIEIPEGVQRIEKGAFSFCNNLKKITFPESLEYIGFAAFDCCENLQEITFGTQLKYIGNGAFNNCGITQVHLPESLSELDKEAFYYCEKLTDIWIPNSVYTFGENIFGPEVFPTVHTPLGSDAQKYFSARNIACDNLGYAADEEEMTECRVINGFEINENVLLKYWGTEKDIAVPDGVTEIESMVFDSAQQVTSITLPPTVTTICDQAFGNCKNLQKVYIPNSVRSIGEWAFSDCEQLQEINLPENLCSVGEWAFSGCVALQKIIWPGSAKEIPSYAFRNCSSLKTVVVAEGVIKIGESAFFGCEALADAYLPGSLCDVGEYAFLMADQLKLHVYVASFARKWAQANNIPVIIEISPEEIAKQKAEEERRRKAAEEAELRRQRMLAEKRARYNEINEGISMQMQIIAQNKGWFGAQAKARKAAQEQLAILQAQLAREFPNGRP